MSSRLTPKLRPVEAVMVPDERHGRVLVLRDPQGIAEHSVQIPPALVPVLTRLDGRHELDRITAEVSQELGSAFPHAAVVEVVRALDEAGYLESPAFERRRREVELAFAEAPVREATHAGGAYPGVATTLEAYLDTHGIPRLAWPAVAAEAPAPKHVRALCAPHIDPWRGAKGYAAAYGALAAGLAPEADTFLVLGTSHAPMHEPFALCKKPFDTPLGALACDDAAIDWLAGEARFDPYRDQQNHQREHSIELQAVFLKRVLGDRPATFIPVLAGLGAAQASGRSPRNEAASAAFLDALGELIAKRGRRMVVIAGVDLAHVGPRFGDPHPFDAEARARLAATDGESLALLAAGEPESFWEHVAADLDTRRVCGLGPMYALAWTLVASGSPRGTLQKYEQNVDPDEGSIVSYAAMTFSL